MPSYSETGLIMRLVVAAGTVLNNVTVKIQVEEGSAATSFEPYSGADYTINLGSTYYGGTLDVASGVMTATWAGIRVGDYQNVLSYKTDRECWQIYATPVSKYHPVSYPICTHSIFNQGSAFDTATNGYFRWTSGGAATVWWFKSPATTSEDFMAIYANAYIVYEIATPYTVQLDPVSISALAQTDKYTPRLNTIYTDASAVQVGYVKSPIREEFELTQAIVAQGGNI